MKVLSPVIGNATTNVISSQSIGRALRRVTGRTQIFLLADEIGTGTPGRVILNKVHYGHFLRVYNRRRYHHPYYLNSLGYAHAKIIGKAVAAERWCKTVFEPGSYVRSYSDFWFAYDRDHTLFLMRWS
jgi:hypothetical protein